MLCLYLYGSILLLLFFPPKYIPYIVCIYFHFQRCTLWCITIAPIASSFPATRLSQLLLQHLNKQDSSQFLQHTYHSLGQSKLHQSISCTYTLEHSLLWQFLHSISFISAMVFAFLTFLLFTSLQMFFISTGTNCYSQIKFRFFLIYFLLLTP